MAQSCPRPKINAYVVIFTSVSYMISELDRKTLDRHVVFLIYTLYINLISYYFYYFKSEIFSRLYGIGNWTVIYLLVYSIYYLFLGNLCSCNERWTNKRLALFSRPTQRFHTHLFDVFVAFGITSWRFWYPKSIYILDHDANRCVLEKLVVVAVTRSKDYSVRGISSTRTKTGISAYTLHCCCYGTIS